MVKLAVLDKDGTLVNTRSGKPFTQDFTDQVLIPGVERACHKLIANGFRLVIASNQGGVAAGHKTLESACVELKYAAYLLIGCEIEVDSVILCPDFNGNSAVKIHWYDELMQFGLPVDLAIAYPDLIGTFRKPGAGMALSAMRDYEDLEEVLLIGDRQEDEDAARSSGFNFIWADKWSR